MSTVLQFFTLKIANYPIAARGAPQSGKISAASPENAEDEQQSEWITGTAGDEILRKRAYKSEKNPDNFITIAKN